jgi:excisionase family DNA binding protein
LEVFVNTQTADWLTLTEASNLLGIHPITLRSWADAGLVRLFRTPGGHRRFQRAELIAFMEKQSGLPQEHSAFPQPEETLAHIRAQMGTHPIQQASWYTKLSDEQRALHRSLGQQLLGLLLEFVEHQENGGEFLEQARELSGQYGIELARARLGSGDLARAFLFFRRAIIKSAFADQDKAPADAETVRILERINSFMDELLIAALGNYDKVLAQQLTPLETPSAPVSPKRSKAYARTKPRSIKPRKTSHAKRTRAPR